MESNIKRNNKEKSIFIGNTAGFLEKLYADYLNNPSSYDESWREVFSEFAQESSIVNRELQGASWGEPVPSFESDAPKKGIHNKEAMSPDDTDFKIENLIKAYHEFGHLHATLDPLGLQKSSPRAELSLDFHGLTSQEGAPLSDRVRSVFDRLRSFYSGTTGYEFTHLETLEEKQWWRERIESLSDLTSSQREEVLNALTKAELFEKFLQVKFPGAKRFGLEGGESLIPAIELIIQEGSLKGIKEAIIGMAHRGRLNLITNIIQYPARHLLAEFMGKHGHRTETSISGDVKYHMGAASDRVLNQSCVHVSLCANPSHLEAVNPVVQGKVWAKQNLLKDNDQDKVLPILIHGDAAFAGQGVVPETFLLSQLQGYSTGGTVHIIINNQVGFTTSPYALKSSRYCSDSAKGLSIPIIHVNGDDVEACVRACLLALLYRQTFKKDVIVDLVCYRRLGHNEMDEPSFTQPQMYAIIRRHPSTRALYAEKLVENSIFSEDYIKSVYERAEENLQREFEEAQKLSGPAYPQNSSRWASIQADDDFCRAIKTGVTSEEWERLKAALTDVPEGYKLNPKLERFIKERHTALSEGKGIDWATGESLALGALLQDGYLVRLSGQDCGRGTFTQRHAVYCDQDTQIPFIPLQTLAGPEALQILNSPLSEEAVLAFELGCSYVDPNRLVLWEAQFGDFSNGAQIPIDQFISAGQQKWGLHTGLVMLLPHGYDGQGPEHSSARPERYLQLCAQNNMIVANCSTPANYFHILRRQMYAKTRKPLVIMSPKTLLRHKRAVSKASEFMENSSFQPLIPDPQIPELSKDQIRRIVFCTGKIYYELEDSREKLQQGDVLLVRIEQLYPFPEVQIADLLRQYPAAEMVWCQEEPQNMGAWSFLDRRLEKSASSVGMQKRPLYVGRQEAASPATGYLEWHLEEQQAVINAALTL